MEKLHPLYLGKNEDANEYKKFAEQGMDLMFPIRMKGRTHRPDINIPYHATIKLFDTSKDKPEQAHEVASKLSLNPPDPKETRIEPVTLKGRTGYTIHALKLHGSHAENMKEHHKKFSHLGYSENYEFHPHISVDKETWDHIVNSKASTAHEAGIEFMPAELHHKTKVVANYKPKVAAEFGADQPSKDKLTKSEIKDAILMDIDLKSKHFKALSLNDQHLSNYLQDNSDLKEAVMKKHEERLEYHFGNNKYLMDLAREKGIKKAYESFKRK